MLVKAVYTGKIYPIWLTYQHENTIINRILINLIIRISKTTLHCLIVLENKGVSYKGIMLEGRSS